MLIHKARERVYQSNTYQSIKLMSSLFQFAFKIARRCYLTSRQIRHIYDIVKFEYKPCMIKVSIKFQINKILFVLHEMKGNAILNLPNNMTFKYQYYTVDPENLVIIIFILTLQQRYNVWLSR